MSIDARGPLRVAVIGCGNVSRGHIRAWLGEPARACITALVDLAPGQAEARCAEAGLRDVDLLTDFRAALERDDVDAVDLCTPGHLHAEQIVAALEDSVRTSELLHAIWQSHTLEIRVPVHRAHKTG